MRKDAPIPQAQPSLGQNSSEVSILTRRQDGAAAGWWERRAALVIAHPGHELRVHHWLERARPLVLVLTDGSGHAGRSRLASTTAVLERAGAIPGPIYGRLTDGELYRAILDGDVGLFSALADEIARAVAAADVEYVAGDAVEGFNPGHDVCRLLLNAALQRREAASGKRLPNFEFPLDAPPDAGPAADASGSIVVELDDATLHRKLAAARAYPELAAEVEKAFGRFGREPFRVECLRLVRYGLDIGGRFAHPPFYESYGEQQVAAGIYREVIRFRQHLAPLAEGLGRPAASGAVPTCESC